MTLRLRWAHPSVRDTAIEYLASAPHERRTFLMRASADGLLLAISVSGGREGERQRPLLKTDEDWDAFQRRLVEITESGSGTEVRKLLTMLRNLGDESGSLEGFIERDLVALAIRPALCAIRERWSREGQVVTVDDIEAYIEASLATKPLVSPPVFDESWEHYSNRAMMEVEGGLEEESGLRKVEEFVRLIRSVSRTDRRFFEQVNYPSSYRAFFYKVLERLSRIYDSFSPIESGDLEIDEDGPEEPSDEEQVERFWLEAAVRLCEEVASLGQHEDEFNELRDDFSMAASWREERRDQWEGYIEDVGQDYGEMRSAVSSGGDFDIDAFFADL